MKPTVSDFGVPQGLVFGPILFTIYTSPVAKIEDAYGVVQQQYTDDIIQCYVQGVICKCYHTTTKLSQLYTSGLPKMDSR